MQNFRNIYPDCSQREYIKAIYVVPQQKLNALATTIEKFAFLQFLLFFPYIVFHPFSHFVFSDVWDSFSKLMCLQRL